MWWLLMESYLTRNDHERLGWKVAGKNGNDQYRNQAVWVGIAEQKKQEETYG